MLCGYYRVITRIWQAHYRDISVRLFLLKTVAVDQISHTGVGTCMWTDSDCFWVWTLGWHYVTGLLYYKWYYAGYIFHFCVCWNVLQTGVLIRGILYVHTCGVITSFCMPMLFKTFDYCSYYKLFVAWYMAMAHEVSPKCVTWTKENCEANNVADVHFTFQSNC